MDIWKWVHGRCDDLSENGHDELVDYIDRISTHAVNDEFDKMDQIYHAAIPLCKALDDKWLEVYFRHWRLQGHVLRNYDAKGLLNEAISLLDFSHQDETKDCPQRICTVQDLAACYGIKDGPGFSDERIAVCRETLNQIDGSWPCYECISGELIDALDDGGKHEEALDQLKIIDEELAKYDSKEGSELTLSRTRIYIDIGDLKQAWETIENADNPLGGEGFTRSKKLKKCLILCLMGRWGEALEILPTYEDALIAADYFDEWTEIQSLLIRQGLVQNDRDIRQKFHILAHKLQAREASRIAFQILERLIVLCVDSQEKYRAEIVLGQMNELLGQFNRDLGASDIIKTLSLKIEAISDISGVESFEDVDALLKHDFENESQKVKSVKAALAKWPDDGRLYAVQSDLLQSCFEHEKAFEILKQAYAEHFGSSALESRYGEAYLDRFGFEKYRENFQIDKLEGLSNGAIWNRIFLHIRHYEDKDPARAIADLEKLKTYWPDDVWLMGRIAGICLKLDNFEKSISYRREQIEHDPENNNHKWDLLIVATLGQEKDIVIEMSEALGFKVNEKGHYPKENRERIRLQWVQKNGDETEYRADRIGPVLARIISISTLESGEQVYGKEVVFDPAPLNVLDQEDEEGYRCDKDGYYTQLFPKPLKIISDPSYKTYPVDGLHPGEDNIQTLIDKLVEHDFICQIRSNETYQLTWADAGKNRTDDAIYLYVLIPDGQQAKLNSILLAYNQTLDHPLVWSELATDLDDAKLLEAQKIPIDKYGIYV